MASGTISSSLITFFPMGAKPPNRTQNSPESDSVSSLPSSAMWYTSYSHKQNENTHLKNKYSKPHGRLLC